MIKYIIYHFLNFNGAGYTPAQQVQQAGADFKGGLWKQSKTYFGYLVGDSEVVDEAVNALTGWRVDELTEAEALAWSEAALPVNTAIEEPEGTRYIGPAEVDVDGYIQRPLSNKPWEV